ncbi:MAG TPA: hypothetical protein VFI06_03800 [Chitinophagaceae bacterium]|nr:hypothetical protein [Chitinophagaceae bacterium]
MKKILVVLVALVSFSFISADNPLKNTKWDGGNGLVVYFTASDTVKLLMNDEFLTSAQYKVKDSVLTWRDFVPGAGSCDTAIRGTYVYRIKDSILTFRPLSDRCEVRANVIQTLVLIRK